ncbi:TetR/AcrR family transcriptional regulator [Luteolibacter sp. Populi]|uniref:TetR/AcrR family transcriptional regulator n=1 Tax=Luteolibacter sp. Populi TaxID=3230487 RepID=UPI0034672371
MSESESKERLLAAAKALILAQGFAGTTVDQICGKAKLTKGSFYHFFKSKEELGIAVLEWSMKKGGEILVDGPHAKVADPVERAFAFLKHVESCAPKLWSSGCILASFSLELAATNKKMQKVVSRMFRETEEFFASELKPLADESSPASSSELGQECLALLEGSIILAQAHREPERIGRAIRGFREHLQNLAAAAK